MCEDGAGCPLTPEVVGRLLDDALPEDEQRRCDEHVRRCASCRRELAELRALVPLVRAALRGRGPGVR
ncbi:MAG: anti-sigma factor family protein [Natronosporangium sp.]